MSDEPVNPEARIKVRALLLSDRIDTANIERERIVSNTPLAYRLGNGFVTVFRYGVVVLIGLSPRKRRPRCAASTAV